MEDEYKEIVRKFVKYTDRCRKNTICAITCTLAYMRVKTI